ncbi:MAG: universal stress protein [Armatimonadota bacterium]|nr:universal stress protein [Armatimonadota bacterium]MDR7450548.1 universal stress protein [Armatimonadota bacterium]MDR7466319.1 universal stress protein [Armatimonadota bacterium]MDR7493040.1 universal stress protein [Armatimonadota bacterium]MDR7498203.1 universal stress protein [Armatimonadota bacterium]
MEIACILYATDGSSHARKALDWVVDIARRRRARVIVVTAYEPIPRELGSPYLEELMARRPAEARATAAEAEAVLRREGIDHELEVLEGPAADAILRVARTRRCDLIVMGSRGLGRLEVALLGSVSQRVVQEAPCPVLIVR